MMVWAPAAPAGGAGKSPGNTENRDLTDVEVRRTLDMLFDAQVRNALTNMDSLRPYCEGQPMYHLMRARLYRELLPVDDERKEVVKRLAEPLYEELDRVIEVCSRRIDAKDPLPELLLYRGWAYMVKSHVHTFEKSFWSAGRDAKKGKSDLEAYLEINPNDAVANSIMGAFLYFADTLPAAYKFVSKLLFLPGGDRDRGLQMMELARGYNSVAEVDNSLILYSVYLGFEGHYEEGLDGFARLRREYPLHTTFIRPQATMLPLLPRHDETVCESLDAEISAISALPKEQIDWSTHTTVRFMRGYADRYFHPERGIKRLRAITEEAPEHPDWVSAYARFELGRVLAGRGEYKEARANWESILRDSRAEYLHGETSDMIKALDDATTPMTLPAFRVDDIYTGTERARAVRDALEGAEKLDVIGKFYLGEARLNMGDAMGALDAFRQCIATDAKRWNHGYQMLASTRAGEILGSLGQYENAAKFFDSSMKFHHKEFLYDWLTSGRKRYYERLYSGDETTPPTVLTTAR